MTTLAMATVLSLAAQCAPGVAPDTVAAIAQAESGLDPLAIHDNTVQRTFQPADLPEAIALATDLIVAQHHSVDLGLMQVNSANFATLGLSITNAFDACHSIEAGGHVLSSAYQRALRGALSAYNTGDPQRGVSNGYVSRVEHAALSFHRSMLALRRPRNSESPTTRRRGWDVFAQSGGTPFVFTGR